MERKIQKGHITHRIKICEKVMQGLINDLGPFQI